MKLSIIIPCYNEAENIPLILEEYNKLLNNRTDIEVILVDNNSKDNTAEVLNKLAPKYHFLKIVFEPVPGYGSTILAGLKHANNEYVGWTHGDMQTPPQNVISAFELMQSYNSRQDIYIKGKRYGRQLADKIFTLGMSLFETIYMGALLNDINAQPNIFHRSFFESWKNPPTDFSLDLYAFYKAKKEGLKIVRFAVPFLRRIHGTSAWNTGLASKWKFIKRTVKFSQRLKKVKDE